MKKTILLMAMALLLSTACSAPTKAPANPVSSNGNSASAAPAQQGAGTYKLRIATVVSGDENSWVKTSNYIKDEMEKRSAGVVEVSVYPGGQLGNDEACIDDMRLGTLDILVGGTQNLAPFVPQVQVLGVPYLFGDNKEFVSTIEKGKPVFNYIQEQYDAKGLGLQLMGLFYGGERNLHTTKEVTSVAGLKNMKMRVTSSATESLVWSTLGVIPTSMSFNDIYSAVQTNTVSAFECSEGGYKSSALYEVAPYLIRTSHQFTPVHITCSDISFNKLPANFQQMLEEVTAEAAAYGSQLAIDSDEALIETLVKDHKVTLVEVDKAEFKAVVEPLYPKILSECKGEELMEIIVKNK